MAYEFLEHTADLKIKATGKTLQEALIEAARAITETIAGKSRIEPHTEKQFTVVVREPEILVHDFLGKIIFLFSTEQLLFNKFDLNLKEAMGYKLIAKIRGEKYDPTRHKLIKEVKAITYHDMKVTEEDDGSWTIIIVCDI